MKADADQKLKSNQNILVWMLYVIAGGVILYYGRTLFIPISFALLFAFLMYPVGRWLESKGIPRLASSILCTVMVILFFGILLVLGITQLMGFSDHWNSLQPKLIETINNFSAFLTRAFDFSMSQQQEYMQKAVMNSSGQIIGIFQDSIISSGTSLVAFLLIPIYSALILYYRRLLVVGIHSMFDKERRPVVNAVILETIQAYYNFVKGMIVVYIVVGILNSLGLWALGIPNPFLFGFLAAIMTFIPFFGIIIAALLPITVSWVTNDSAWYPLGIVGVFSLVQYLEANFIFPWAVSSKLQINALSTIICIVIGGIVWGAAGMILFVPFMAILKLIADRVPQLAPLSILLGNKEK